MFSRCRDTSLDVSKLHTCALCFDRPLFFTVTDLDAHTMKYHPEQLTFNSIKPDSQSIRVQKTKNEMLSRLNDARAELMTVLKMRKQELRMMLKEKDGYEQRKFHLLKNDVKKLMKRIEGKNIEIQVLQSEIQDTPSVLEKPPALSFDVNYLYHENLMQQLVRKNIDEQKCLCNCQEMLCSIIKHGNDCNVSKETLKNMETRLSTVETKVCQNEVECLDLVGEVKSIIGKNQLSSNQNTEFMTELRDVLKSHQDKILELKQQKKLSKQKKENTLLKQSAMENSLHIEEKNYFQKQIEVMQCEKLTMDKKIEDQTSNLRTVNDQLLLSIQSLTSKTNEHDILVKKIDKQKSKIKKLKFALDNKELDNMMEKFQNCESDFYDPANEMLNESQQEKKAALIDHRILSLKAMVESTTTKNKEILSNERDCLAKLKDIEHQNERSEKHILKLTGDYSKLIKQNEELQKQIEELMTIKSLDQQTILNGKRKVKQSEEELSQFKFKLRMIQENDKSLNDKDKGLKENYSNASQMEGELRIPEVLISMDGLEELEGMSSKKSLELESERKYKQLINDMEVESEMKMKTLQKQFEKEKASYYEQKKQLENQIKRMDLEFQSKHKQLNLNSQTEIQHLEMEKRKLSESYSQLSEEFNRIEKHLEIEKDNSFKIADELNSKISILQLEKEEIERNKNAQISRTQEELKEKIKLGKQFEEVIDSEKKKVTRHESEIGELIKKVNISNQALNISNESNVQLRNRVIEMEKEHSKNLMDRARIIEQIKDKEEKIRNIELQQEELQKNLKSREEKINSLHIKLTDSHHAEINEKLRSAELQKHIEELKSQLTEFQNSQLAQNVKSEEMENNIEELTNQLRESDNVQISQNLKLEELKKYNNDLKNQLADSRSAQISQIVKGEKLENVIEEIKKDSTNKDERLDEMRSTLISYKQENAILTHDIKDLHQQMKDIEKTNKEKAKSHKNEKIQLQKKVKEQRTKNRNLQDDLQNLQEVIKVMETDSKATKEYRKAHFEDTISETSQKSLSKNHPSSRSNDQTESQLETSLVKSQTSAVSPKSERKSIRSILKRNDIRSLKHKNGIVSSDHQSPKPISSERENIDNIQRNSDKSYKEESKIIEGEKSM